MSFVDWKSFKINKRAILFYRELASFVDWKSFKINKRAILFYRELASKSRNLNECKSRGLLEAERHFNVEVEIYYFCQFTILTQFLSFR